MFQRTIAVRAGAVNVRDVYISKMEYLHIALVKYGQLADNVRVSVMYHLMFVNIIFRSVWVAKWPPFGKELLIGWPYVFFVF